MKIKDTEYGLCKVKRSHKIIAHWSNKFIGKQLRLINGNSQILVEINGVFNGKLDNNIEILKYPCNIVNKIKKEIRKIIRISDKFDVSDNAKKLLSKKYNEIFEHVTFE